MKVVWRASARDDLQRHIEYIRQHSPRAATRIRRRLISRIGALRDFPDAGTIWNEDAGVRHLVVTGTPYIVVFLREPQCVTIVAIMHGAQNRS